TRLQGDWSSDVCSSDLDPQVRRHRIRDLRARSTPQARMQRVGVRVGRHSQKLLDERMYLLQRSVRAIAGLIGRRDPPNMRVKHRSEERRVGKEWSNM